MATGEREKSYLRQRGQEQRRNVEGLFRVIATWNNFLNAPPSVENGTSQVNAVMAGRFPWTSRTAVAVPPPAVAAAAVIYGPVQAVHNAPGVANQDATSSGAAATIGAVDGKPVHHEALLSLTSAPAPNAAAVRYFGDNFRSLQHEKSAPRRRKAFWKTIGCAPV
jgi:hypothetical protein